MAKKLILLLLFLIVLVVVIFLAKLYLAKNTQPSPPPPVIIANLPIASPKELTATLPTPQIHSATVGSKKIDSISYKTVSITSPETMIIYPIVNKQINQNQINQIVQNLGFIGNPQTFPENNGLVYLWKNDETVRSLTIAPQRGFVEYTADGFFGKVDGGQPSYTLVRDKNQAVDIATKFLRDKGFYTPDLSVSNHDVSFITDGFEGLETTKPENAQFILIPFKRSIDQKTLYLPNGDSNQVYVTINIYGMVTKMDFNLGVTLDTGLIAHIIPFDEAKVKIKGGQGTIVRYGDSSYDTTENTENFADVNIINADLGYLADVANNFIQPIYVFQGQASYKNSSTPIGITIFLPALKQQ